MTWEHKHKRYTDAEALAAAIAGGLSKIVWKDASEVALSDVNRTVTKNWSNLDLTAYTSANAKFAILNLQLVPDSITVGAGNVVYLQVRKDGTTPATAPSLIVDGVSEAAGSLRLAEVIVAMTAGQVIEYRIYIGGTAQVDTTINVLGYIE